MKAIGRFSQENRTSVALPTNLRHQHRLVPVQLGQHGLEMGDFGQVERRDVG